MKTAMTLLIALILLAGSACSNKKYFNVIGAPNKKMSEHSKLEKIKNKYAERMGKKFKFQLYSEKSYQFTTNMKLLAGSDKFDMAIINNSNYSSKDSLTDEYGHLKVVLPLSSRIMYIAYNKEKLEPASLEDLLEGNNVVILSYEIEFIKDILSDFGVDVSKVNFLESRYNTEEPKYKKADSSFLDSLNKIDFYRMYRNKEVLPYDIEIGFVPYSFFTESRLYKFLNQHNEFSLFSLDDYHMFNSGSLVEGFCLRNKYFTPYLLPKGTYGEFPKSPILSIRQDYILIAKDYIDDELIYEFVKTAIEETDLIDLNLYGKSFNNINFAFPLHEGTKRYLDKNAPTFVEKYSDKLAKIGTGIGGFYTALVGFFLWRKRRNRRSINTDYQKVLDIQSKLQSPNDTDSLKEMYSELQAIQQEYHKKVLERKILIDETLKIFFDVINKNELYILELLKGK
ncbi:MAG: hypothetical protein HW421_3814 [Ignavibacteria bacterium]|nr:hypothetical protein [Ignavibacteria bacterium]